MSDQHRESTTPAEAYFDRTPQPFGDTATANYLPEMLETTEAERFATGFIFTEGPLWHPDDYW